MPPEIGILSSPTWWLILSAQVYMPHDNAILSLYLTYNLQVWWRRYSMDHLIYQLLNKLFCCPSGSVLYLLLLTWRLQVRYNDKIALSYGMHTCALARRSSAEETFRDPCLRISNKFTVKLSDRAPLLTGQLVVEAEGEKLSPNIVFDGEGALDWTEDRSSARGWHRPPDFVKC